MKEIQVGYLRLFENIGDTKQWSGYTDEDKTITILADNCQLQVLINSVTYSIIPTEDIENLTYPQLKELLQHKGILLPKKCFRYRKEIMPS